MNTHKLLIACRATLVAALFTCTSGVVNAQEQPAAERPVWQSAIDDFRKKADERMKILLEANDDEYAILKPRIEKLQRMQMASDSRMMGFGMMMGRGGNLLGGARPAAGGQNANQPAENPMAPIMKYLGIEANPAVEKAKEMQAALESNEASTELLKRRLAELRAAKKQVKEEMTRAQEELRQICTVRQETVLVLMGLLE